MRGGIANTVVTGILEYSLGDRHHHLATRAADVPAPTDQIPLPSVTNTLAARVGSTSYPPVKSPNDGITVSAALLTKHGNRKRCLAAPRSSYTGWVWPAMT